MSAGVHTDRRLWRSRRANLLRNGRHPLHDELAVSFEERLSGIRREFPTILLLGACAAVAERLANRCGTNAIFLGDGSADLAAAARRFGAPVAMDEEALPFAPDSAELVVGALTLHWVNDLVGALIQIRLCLKPDGLFLGALLGGATLHELRECLAEAEIECSGALGLRVAPMAGIRELGAILQRAGFALPVVDSEPSVRDYPNVVGLMRDLRGMGEANALASRGKTLRRDVIARTEALYRERYPGRDGGIRATFDVLHLCGWAPHASQQKPLRPGTAVSRLAEALGTREISAGERAGSVAGTGKILGKEGEFGR